MSIKLEYPSEEIEHSLLCGDVVVAVVTFRRAYPHENAKHLRAHVDWARDNLGNSGEDSDTYECPVCGGRIVVGDTGPKRTVRGSIVYSPFASHEGPRGENYQSYHC